MILLSNIQLFLLLVFLGFQHPLHISVTNIEYKTTDENFTVSFKVFSDDFENILESKYGQSVDYTNVEKSKVLYKKYVDEHFRLECNGRPLTLVFNNQEMNHEAIWLYFNSSEVKNPETVRIKHTLMYDKFKDQKNLIIFTYNDLQKGYQLQYDEDILEIQI